MLNLDTVPLKDGILVPVSSCRPKSVPLYSTGLHNCVSEKVPSASVNLKSPSANRESK